MSSNPFGKVTAVHFFGKSQDHATIVYLGPARSAISYSMSGVLEDRL